MATMAAVQTMTKTTGGGGGGGDGDGDSPPPPSSSRSSPSISLPPSCCPDRDGVGASASFRHLQHDDDDGCRGVDDRKDGGGPPPTPLIPSKEKGTTSIAGVAGGKKVTVVDAVDLHPPSVSGGANAAVREKSPAIDAVFQTPSRTATTSGRVEAVEATASCGVDNSTTVESNEANDDGEGGARAFSPNGEDEEEVQPPMTKAATEGATVSVSDDRDLGDTSSSTAVPRSLASLLSSCASITTSALSCRTLTTGGGLTSHLADEDGGGDEQADYAAELEVGRWLDSQIDEYRAALIRREEQQQRTIDHDNEAGAGENASHGVEATVEPGGAKSSPHGDDDPSSRKRPRPEEPPSKIDPTQHRLQRRRLRREVGRLRVGLFDRTVRSEQCGLLLNRVAATTAASLTAFPRFASERRVRLLPPPRRIDDDGWEVEDQHPEELYLMREALRSRDDLVLSALGKMKSAAEARAELDTVTDECRGWRRRNRDLWTRIHSAPPRSGDGNGDGDGDDRGSATPRRADTVVKDGRRGEGGCAVSNKATGGGGNGGCDSHIIRNRRAETALLRRALMDTIVGSGLDWYSDQRLRETMRRLEEVCDDA